MVNIVFLFCLCLIWFICFINDSINNIYDVLIIIGFIDIIRVKDIKIIVFRNLIDSVKFI